MTKPVERYLLTARQIAYIVDYARWGNPGRSTMRVVKQALEDAKIAPFTGLAVDRERLIDILEHACTFGFDTGIEDQRGSGTRDGTWPDFDPEEYIARLLAPAEMAP